MNAELKTIDIAKAVRRAISQETKIPEDQLREDEPLESYGVESVMSVAIVRRLEETFGELSKTLVFEYQTIESLLGYFAQEHGGKAISSTRGPAAIPEGAHAIHAHSRLVPEGMKLPSPPPLVPERAVTGATPAMASNPNRATARVESEANQETRKAVPTTMASSASTIRRQRAGVSEVAVKAGDESGGGRDEIAIIGISGRFPQARNLEEFWKNLSQGRDCITEIPDRLWDWRDYWSSDRGMAGKSYSKWGGFIEDSDCFDPLFFNISNLVAESMDPQERLFLETVHHTLEDAGYAREHLRGKRIGLYVSAMWGSYQHYGVFDASTDSSFASIANRASYFFDLRGPSIALDTTCSGSLTTVHLACESLRTGETDLAIAGGVNITSHPHKYLVLSRTGFASIDGRCGSFAADANGYVPGDGVGALLLKPLAKAIADGDHINAVIKSTSINHGGRTSGFTVPSTEAQASLIEIGLRKAGINPRSITYVEAHAPGTALGDPIEIRGLTNAFRKYTEDTGFCAIGSVKSNIGHLESAAGFASIAKVVLQMQHKQLVPSIHSEKLNPNIQFDNTPFYVQRELTAWQTPIQATEGPTRYPRRAAISAFGAGGSNAHVILEEYATPMVHRVPSAEQLIVLSAKTEDRLHAVVENLLGHVTLLARTDSQTDYEPQAPIAERLLRRVSDVSRVRVTLLDSEDRLDDLLTGAGAVEMLIAQLQDEFGIALDALSLDSLRIGDLITAVARHTSGTGRSYAEQLSAVLEQIAYTLQVGREAMQHRFATVVRSLPELEQRLRSYLAGEADPEQRWTGKVLQVAANVAARAEEADYIARLLRSHRFGSLGRLWCNGAVIPWIDLYSDPKPRRIGLPLYPFARERCWVERPVPRAAVDRVDQQVPPSRIEMVDTVSEVGHNRRASTIISIDDAGLQRLVFRPRWLPVLTPAQENIDTKQQLATAPTATATHLLVYPPGAASVIDALKGLLPPGDIYEIVLGSRTELSAGHRWEVDVFDEQAIDACVEYIDTVDTVYFLGGYQLADTQPGTKTAFDRLQAQGVLALFRLVKTLQKPRRAGGKAPRLKVIVNYASGVMPDERVQPYTAAVLGFARAVARECPQLATEIFDIDVSEESPAPTDLYAVLHYVIDGVSGHPEFAVRSGQAYVRQLQPYDLEEASKPVFKKNGVYVLIGGAGIVGTKLSYYLARSVSARLVWVGRRPCDESIKAHMIEIERLGGRLSYITADATDGAQVTQAFDTVELEYGGVDGVLHLAMVHEVTRIEDLNEAQMKRTLAAKVDSTYTLYSVLRRRSVGFVALFSSAEAYVGNTGWGAYAGACSFQDVFALYWSQQATWPVLSVNWGYWEGVVPEAAEILAAKGIHQLSVAQGSTILERALANRTGQVTALNVEDQVLERMGIVPRKIPVREERRIGRPAARAPKLEPISVAPVVVVTNGASAVSVAPTAVKENEALPAQAAVNEELVNLLSNVLKINKARFDVDADLINYGIDSLTVLAVHKTLESKVGSLPATLFITFHTISAVGAHLLKQYPAAARALVDESTLVPAGEEHIVPEHTAAVPRAKSPDVTLLRRLDPSGIAKYLEQYGTLYRDGMLEQAAERMTTQELSFATGEGRELSHVLVSTPSAESVELFAIGSGVPVLLLPAIGLTGPTWRYQLTSALTKTMRLFVPHPPGYGLSKPIRNCSTQGVGDVFKEVIDLIAPGQPVHVVGSCLGCVTAAYLARSFPDRVASLTLVGAFHNTSEMLVGDPDRLTADELSHMLVSAVEKVKTDFAGVTKLNTHAGNGTSPATEALLAFLLNSLCANSLIAMRYLSEMLTLSLLDWLPEIEAPTQCIYGTNDKIVTPQHSRTISKAIPEARLVAIEGAGHFPYLTHSEQFNSLLERFVREHESTRSVSQSPVAV